MGVKGDKMRAHYSAFVMGTATWDRVVKRTGPPNDSKSVRVFRYTQSGGGAINARKAFEAQGQATNCGTVVWACAKFGETGPQNPYKDKILEEIGDHHLLDPAYRREAYTISDNDITIWNDLVTDNVKRSITKAQDDIETEIYPELEGHIIAAVAECDVVILNSRFPDIALIAAKEAKRLGIPVLLDYSETSPSLIARCEDLIKMSDDVLADGHALLPGMEKADGDELRRRLVEDYGCENVAVSDNRTPIKVYTNGEYLTVPVPMPDVLQVDNLGTGDVRDAICGFYIADRQDFLTSVIYSSVIASHSVSYPGREWIATLSDIIPKLPSFVKPVEAYRDKDRTAVFAAAAISPLPHEGLVSVSNPEPST
jgi:sugar/nucleoside kinase (ribokinase family)